MSTATETLQPVYRFFRTTLARSERLSPSFLRLTFTGPDLDRFGVGGADQRFKLLLAQDGHPLDDLLAITGPDWYPAWCAMPDETRPHMRTYTVRAFRPEVSELDVDVVLHGIGADGSVGEGAGPAAVWAARAVPGDEMVFLGPDRPGAGRMWGVEWAPPAEADTLFLAGDETAVPAIAAIVEALPGDQRVVAVLEVPEAGDFLPLRLPPGVDVRWLARGSRPRGELMETAVHAALRELGIARDTPGVDPEAGDPAEDDILWEVPEAGAHTSCYAWLAGEAGVVKELRRRLVRDLGVPRDAVAFMGYWRTGARAAG
ncbi:NADPH-dependent ferric siderophore reductase, contains FAD-binding and SIP domains [Klenkia soli]|uniref:NADPH-dependent ferric siderophore reductase, contains FAD-binding and SIP domains n=1 Tax=Klenkia soli TaxID=1052260 RepID=A0A1H0QDX1_9ACTN|nr:siderophore-interacting protein [Klenkia soli]SDP14878.1 NADPH-dependent ferric siderophore reductase, contains FAD-binding and SIP domains [Klenkia soli]